MTAASTPTWSDADRARIRGGIARLFSDLDDRGATLIGPLNIRLRALARWLDRGRPPRIAVVGRRGSGKSSLLNALTSRELAPTGPIEDTTADPRTYEISLEGSSADWIDTPGLRAGGVDARRLDLVVDTLNTTPPDLLVWAHPASETDAGVDDEVSAIQRILTELARAHGWTPELLTAITRVDELDPPDVIDPPFDDPVKQAHIEAAVQASLRALARQRIACVEALPVAAWFSSSMDLRWNIPLLASQLHAGLRRRPIRDDREELRALYHRLSMDLAALVGRLGRGRSASARDALRAWFVSTLWRVGPVAARSLDLERDPSRLDLLGWARRGLDALGAARSADAIERRALARLADEWMASWSSRAPDP